MDSPGPVFAFVWSIAIPGSVSAIRLKAHVWRRFRSELERADLYPEFGEVFVRGIPVLPPEPEIYPCGCSKWKV